MAALAGEARQVRPGRVVAAIICSVFYAIGWCAAASLVAVSWSVAAVKVGWQDGRAVGTPGRAGG